MIKTKSSGRRAFEILNITFLTGLVVVTLYPFLNLLAVSFSSPEAILSNKVSIFPVDFNFEAYKKVFTNEWVFISYKNTIVYTVLGTLFNLICSTAAAYPLSKKRLLLRKQINFYFIFTMLFGGGLIPTYLVVRTLGLIDSMWAIILPAGVIIYYTILLRSFFEQIPVEMEEAAKMDGMGNLGILMKIYVPLSVPIYATLILFFSVDHWNSWFSALIYLNSKTKYPIQIILREIILSGTMDDMERSFEQTTSMTTITQTLKAATTMIVIIPILMVYPFVQKYFVNGLMLGSVKG